MPRGGRRPGAGRKPKLRMVLGGMPTLPGIELPKEAISPLVDPPRDLVGAGPRALWRRLAPAALREKTLTLETAAGFRLLVETHDLANRVRDGILTAKPDVDVSKAVRTYAGLAQRVDAMLARFKLTGFGKPSESAAPRPVGRNAWAEVKR